MGIASENSGAPFPASQEAASEITAEDEMEAARETAAADGTDAEEENVMKVNVQIGDSIFTATLEENAAADAFAEMINEEPIVIQMRDYSGFEKVGALGTSLPTDNRQTSAQPGDIVLYNGNQIVIIYGSNSWSYTRLGKIDDLTGWKEALGREGVTVTFSLTE